MKIDEIIFNKAMEQWTMNVSCLGSGNGVDNIPISETAAILIIKEFNLIMYEQGHLKIYSV